MNIPSKHLYKYMLVNWLVFSNNLFYSLVLFLSYILEHKKKIVVAWYTVRLVNYMVFKRIIQECTEGWRQRKKVITWNFSRCSNVTFNCSNSDILDWKWCLTAEGNCVLPNGSVFTILRAMSSTVLCTGVTIIAFRNVIF